MPLTWMKYLDTGVEWIDRQHRELFDRFNDILEAMGQRRGREEMARLFAFLDSYVIFHFGMEENLMKLNSYDKAEEHLNEHSVFKEKIAGFKREYETGADLSSLINTQDYLMNWLLNHIGKSDVRLGKFLKEKGVA